MWKFERRSYAAVALTALASVIAVAPIHAQGERPTMRREAEARPARGQYAAHRQPLAHAADGVRATVNGTRSRDSVAAPHLAARHLVASVEAAEK